MRKRISPKVASDADMRLSSAMSSASKIGAHNGWGLILK